MSENILFVGLDVDDNAFHGSALQVGTGEVADFKIRPTLKGLIDKLTELKKKLSGSELRVCYEASYVGFSLKRDLEAASIHCDVVAPSSIPRVGGNHVKTDRIDACKLCQFYSANMLTIVAAPTPELEQDRDLLRSRQFIMNQLTEIRTHIQSMLRRSGRNYKSEENMKSHWTRPHLCWLDRLTLESPGSFGKNLKFLLQQMKWLMHTLSEYGVAVEELTKQEQYVKPVQALVCYKGIANVFAMTIITEIGDVKRFKHPGALVSWMGLDIREYSSGGKHNRFGITKHGNRYLRNAFCEANQRTYQKRALHKKLKTRRTEVPPELTSIADRCMERLAKKGTRMLYAGKHVNKIKIACAREMVGFVWESLNKVAA